MEGWMEKEEEDRVSFKAEMVPSYISINNSKGTCQISFSISFSLFKYLECFQINFENSLFPTRTYSNLNKKPMDLINNIYFTYLFMVLTSSICCARFRSYVTLCSE